MERGQSCRQNRSSCGSGAGRTWCLGIRVICTGTPFCLCPPRIIDYYRSSVLSQIAISNFCKGPWPGQWRILSGTRCGQWVCTSLTRVTASKPFQRAQLRNTISKFALIISILAQQHRVLPLSSPFHICMSSSTVTTLAPCNTQVMHPFPLPFNLNRIVSESLHDSYCQPQAGTAIH